MDRKLGLGIVGVGYWGANYLRVIRQLKDAKLKCVCDKDAKRLGNITESEDTHLVDLTGDLATISKNKDLDAVIIATPASTHYNIAKIMLEAGKHVLVEKPLTMDYEQAMALCDLAKSLNRVLMVGHIYCFNPAVNYIKDVIASNRLGDIYYGIGLRLGLGPIRGDASCTWDLATHDIAMLDYLVNKMPISVTAQESSFLQRESGIHDYATIQLKYDGGFQFSLTVSWYAAEKIRMWYLMGSKSMLKFDDIDKNSPITFYDKSVSVKGSENGGQNSYTLIPRTGDTTLPYVRQDEPLTLEIKHFIESINSGKKPLTDGYQGARVIKIIDAIEASMKVNGKPVTING